MPSDDAPFTPDATGVRLAVRLTPRAHRTRIDGIVSDADGRAALRIHLAAPPVDGAANQALVGFLAEALGVPKSSVTIRSGAMARLKILHIAGDAADLAARLARLIAARPASRAL